MAFNATSQVSYYYSPWQPSPGSVALPSSTTSHRNETPFRPSPHGLQAPTRLSPSPLPLPLSLLFLFLPRFFTDLWTRWFIHSVNRGPVGRFRLLFLGFQGEGEREERVRERERRRRGRRNVSQARLWIAGWGGPCWFSTKSTAPKMGPIVLLATNR